MKKIGREVLFLRTDKKVTRNGEGAFIRLKDGSVMYAFTEFNSDNCDDHGAADIAACFSNDEGETWHDRRLLLKADKDAINYMSVSLLRMENGDIGLFFCRKERRTFACQLHLARSSDEGRTWSSPLCCVDKAEYFVTCNDRVIRLKSGRLLAPLNVHPFNEKHEISYRGGMGFLASDDDGRTWKEIAKRVEMPFASSTGLQETGLYQYEDGSLWAWSRTGFGCQFECFSADEGKSWTAPAPSEFFTSPASPMNVKKVGTYTVAIFNPIPEYRGRDLSRTWGRTPLICAVSKDDGKTFPQLFCLEDDPENGYCYPAILEGRGYLLVSYHHSNGTGNCNTSNKVIKIIFDELGPE